MAKNCKNEHCYAPDTACNLGEETPEQCKYWRGDQVEADSLIEESSREKLLPWSGRTMGLDDAAFIAARSSPRIIGIVGAHNAGKTTMLVAWYILLSRGMRLPDRLFAGSASFEGWENLACWLRWPPHGFGPAFPPHTSVDTKRAPGLLHLAFRRSDGGLEDVLITDGPGEWFESWATNQNDANAEGARWTAKYADVFLFVVDCEMLSGPDRGQARSKTLDLARRLADHVSGRPVAVVFAKSDKVIPQAIRQTLETEFCKVFPEHVSFALSIYGGQDDQTKAEVFMRVLSTALKEPEVRGETAIHLPHSESADFFLQYRSL